MAYTPTAWVNGSTPALNAGNLLNMEQGIAAAYAALPTSSPILNPVTGMVHASAFGLVSDGVFDNSGVFDDIAEALDGFSATIWLGAEAGGKGIIGLSRPIVGRNGQRFVGPAITAAGDDNRGLSVTLRALDGFTGDAVFESYTWTGGGGGVNNWHWASVEWLVVDCDSNCDYGIAIHQMGENAVIREVLVKRASVTNIILTGAHAPCRLEHVSTFVSTGSTQYGVALTSHPAGAPYTGNSGVVTFDGLSGDGHEAAHIYIDGQHSVDLSGWKSEGHSVGVLLAGTGTPNIHVTGYFNSTTFAGSADVFKITGTGGPRIASYCRSALALNYINDTVNNFTYPVDQNVPGQIIYNGRIVLGGPTVRSRAAQTRTGNGGVTINAASGDFHEVTLAGNATSCTISNTVPGRDITITFIQDGTGGRSYVWPTAIYDAGAAPTNLATAAARDTVRLLYDGSAWYELSRSQQSPGPTKAIFTPAKSGRYLPAPPVVSQVNNSAFTLNSLRFMPVFFDRASTVTAIGVYVPTGVGSSTIRLGLYADTDGAPSGAALVDAGTVDSSTTGFKEVTGLSVAVSIGRYWVAAVTQGVAAQMSGVLGIAPGIPQLAGYSGSDQTCYVHANSVSGALPTADPNSTGRGAITAVKVA